MIFLWAARRAKRWAVPAIRYDAQLFSCFESTCFRCLFACFERDSHFLLLEVGRQKVEMLEAMCCSHPEG